MQKQMETLFEKGKECGILTFVNLICECGTCIAVVFTNQLSHVDLVRNTSVAQGP